MGVRLSAARRRDYASTNANCDQSVTGNRISGARPAPPAAPGTDPGAASFAVDQTRRTQDQIAQRGTHHGLDWLANYLAD